MKCELLGFFYFFFFPADVAGSASPHFLIDMVEVMEKEHGTEMGQCSPWHCREKLQDKHQTYFEGLQNQYFTCALGLCSNKSSKACDSEKDTHEY